MSVEFTNVQVSRGDRGGDVRDDLVDAIEEAYREDEEWERVERAGEADRTVAVGPTHGDGWVGAYFRDPRPGPFAREFARAVSGQRGVRAVGFHGAGRHIQLYFADDGDEVGGLDSERGGEPDTDALKFAGALTGGRAGADEIRELWSDLPAYADESANRFAELWGMEPALVSAGFHYLELNVTGPVDEFHFRRRSEERLLERVDGEASFESEGRVRELEGSVGEDFRATASFGNRGGAVTGLRVVVDGEAVDQSLVEIEAIRIDGGATGDFEECDATHEEGASGHRRAVATFPERTIEGALSGDVDFSELSDEQSREVMQAHRETRVSVYALGRSSEPGNGEIRIALEPIEEQGGGAEERSHVVVYPRSRRPRPADPESAPPHTLRQLEKEETLFALVHFDSPIGAWSSLAAEAIGTWAGEISAPDDAVVEVAVPDLRSRPDESLRDAASFRDAEYVAELVGRIADLYQFSAILRPAEFEDRQFEPDETGGFSYFSLGGPESGSEGEAAPALGFWVGIEERGEDEVEQLRNTLREIVDAFARSGRVVQGIVDAWAWAPSMSIRSLPYEIVCGLSSSGHLRLDWLRRFLRAATPLTWTGAALWDRLDAAAVEEVAAVEQLGDVHRVSLREDADLDDLERVFAAILPDSEAWSREANA